MLNAFCFLFLGAPYPNERDSPVPLKLVMLNGKWRFFEKAGLRDDTMKMKFKLPWEGPACGVVGMEGARERVDLRDLDTYKIVVATTNICRVLFIPERGDNINQDDICCLFHCEYRSL